MFFVPYGNNTRRTIANFTKTAATYTPENTPLLAKGGYKEAGSIEKKTTDSCFARFVARNSWPSLLYKIVNQGGATIVTGEAAQKRPHVLNALFASSR